MKSSLLAALLLLPLSASAEPKTVYNSAKLDLDKLVRLEMNQGYLTISPASGWNMTYKVEFVPDEGCKALFHRVCPSAQDYADSAATYDAASGDLAIHAGAHLDAVVTLEIPAQQPLTVHLHTGAAKIGALIGKLDAFVEDGILNYDSSALAAGVCVSARVDDGIADNKRAFKCAAPGAVLHARTGVISVR